MEKSLRANGFYLDHDVKGLSMTMNATEVCGAGVAGNREVDRARSSTVIWAASHLLRGYDRHATTYCEIGRGGEYGLHAVHSTTKDQHLVKSETDKASYSHRPLESISGRRAATHLCHWRPAILRPIKAGQVATELPPIFTPPTLLHDISWTMTGLPYPCTKRVIDQLISSRDVQTLRSCSLVSRDWRTLVCPAIFSSLVFRNNDQLIAFCEFLRAGRGEEIRHLVQSLTIAGSVMSLVQVTRPGLAILIHLMPNITRIELDYVVWSLHDRNSILSFCTESLEFDTHVQRLTVTNIFGSIHDTRELCTLDAEGFSSLFSVFKQVDELRIRPQEYYTALLSQDPPGKVEKLRYFRPTVVPTLAIGATMVGANVLQWFYDFDMHTSLERVQIDLKSLHTARALGDFLSLRDSSISTVVLVSSADTWNIARVHPKQYSAGLRLYACKTLECLAMVIPIESDPDCTIFTGTVLSELLDTLSPRHNPDFTHLIISFIASTPVSEETAMQRLQDVPWARIEATLIRNFWGRLVVLIDTGERPISDRMYATIEQRLAALRMHGIGLSRYHNVPFC
ncbi:hypothetical protein NM688_g3742 [Phlebia brevispora]|uniref:Uncharacterized protein n=1 Tax=Phlebia brevispora TaxID=194682 RepID=A0ACC1T554_9APHY|nr:hypothetical protein NM688_g3742 [Phlebia brevispora]